MLWRLSLHNSADFFFFSISMTKDSIQIRSFRRLYFGIGFEILHLRTFWLPMDTLWICIFGLVFAFIG